MFKKNTVVYTANTVEQFWYLSELWIVHKCIKCRFVMLLKIAGLDQTQFCYMPCMVILISYVEFTCLVCYQNFNGYLNITVFYSTGH